MPFIFWSLVTPVVTAKATKGICQPKGKTCKPCWWVGGGHQVSSSHRPGTVFTAVLDEFDLARIFFRPKDVTWSIRKIFLIFFSWALVSILNSGRRETFGKIGGKVSGCSRAAKTIETCEDSQGRLGWSHVLMIGPRDRRHYQQISAFFCT